MPPRHSAAGASFWALGCEVPARRASASTAAVSASLDAISKAGAAMSRWVIAAGLKLIVVPVDSTWMRRSLASGSRARASHASRARAGRSRQRQSKWAGSTRRCTRTALVTAPFLFGTIPAFSALPCGYFRSGCRSTARRFNASGGLAYGRGDHCGITTATACSGPMRAVLPNGA